MRIDSKKLAMLKRALDANYRCEVEKLRVLQTDKRNLENDLENTNARLQIAPNSNPIFHDIWRKWLFQSKAEIVDRLSAVDEEISHQRSVTTRWFAKVKGHEKIENNVSAETKLVVERRATNGQ